MSSWFNPKTEKRTSPIHGRGLFARVTIPAGEVVAVKGGAIMDRAAFALARDQVSPAEIQIVRFEPGARFPVHTHESPEFLFILEGELVQAGRRMGPGWASVASAGTI